VARAHGAGAGGADQRISANERAKPV